MGSDDGQISTALQTSLITPLQSLFGARASVTPEDILSALPGVTSAGTASPFEFSVSLDVRTFSQTVGLEFSRDALGKVIGIVALPGKSPSQTITLAGTITLNFIFGPGWRRQFRYPQPVPHGQREAQPSEWVQSAGAFGRARHGD